MSYQCAIDAVASRCFPSYAMRRGRQGHRRLRPFRFLLVAAALAEGWAVSVPDHEGSTGMWGAPYEPGYHNPRRRPGRHQPPDVPALRRLTGRPVGYSGGGLASAWAAEVHAAYAPSSTWSARSSAPRWATSGNTFRRLNGSIYSGLPALVVAALTHIYPDLDRIISEHATPDGKALLERIQKIPPPRR